MAATAAHANPSMFEPEPELDLRDYVRILARRKGVIALAFLAVVATAMAATFVRTPVYAAEAELLLQARVSEAIFDPSGSQQRDADRAVETEIQLIESEPVRQKVADRLGTAPEISASQVGTTDVIRVKARHTDADRAALIANTYAQAYIEFRREQTVADLLTAGQEIQEKIDGLEDEIVAVEAEIEAARTAEAGDTPSVEVDVDTLREQRGALVTQQSVFRQQLDQLQVGAALRSGGAQLVTPAEAPDSPAEPQPARTAALAVVVGLIFGVGLAFLFDYLDDSVRDDEDLERATEGLPVLGTIPSVSEWKREERPYVVSISEPDSTTAEAYRALRTSVQFLGIDRTMRTIQVTSAIAREGKTTTLVNLGVLFARAGHRVVLVDCDLRRPRAHSFFGLSNEKGFTSVLLGDASLSDAVQEVPSVNRLSVLASGPVPPLPSELLQSARTGEVLHSLAEDFDVALVDSPPALPVTDASILASWVDGLLVVATAQSTSRRHLQRAFELLRQVDAPLVGTVLNRAPAHTGYGYGYGYGYAPYTNGSTNGHGDTVLQADRRSRKERKRGGRADPRPKARRS